MSRFTSAVLKEGPHDGHYTAKLTIDKVTKEDQESENVLVVKNDLGETQYKFRLGVGERPPVGESLCKTGKTPFFPPFADCPSVKNHTI